MKTHHCKDMYEIYVFRMVFIESLDNLIRLSIRENWGRGRKQTYTILLSVPPPYFGYKDMTKRLVRQTQHLPSYSRNVKNRSLSANQSWMSNRLDPPLAPQFLRENLGYTGSSGWCDETTYAVGCHLFVDCEPRGSADDGQCSVLQTLFVQTPWNLITYFHPHVQAPSLHALLRFKL